MWGGPQESHLTPLATRTANEELSAESFMTRMCNEVYQASSFKIYVFKNFGFNITHLESSLACKDWKTSQGLTEKGTNCLACLPEKPLLTPWLESLFRFKAKSLLGLGRLHVFHQTKKLFLWMQASSD